MIQAHKSPRRHHLAHQRIVNDPRHRSRIVMTMRIPFIAAVFTCLASAAFAQETPRKLLLLTQSKGYQHEVVKRTDNKPSIVEQTFAQLADKTKLFTVESTKDASILTPEKLTSIDILAMYTTGDLPADPQVIADWVNNGGLLLGLH